MQCPDSSRDFAESPYNSHMVETGNREIVEKFFQALNAHDWESMERFLDAEYVWEMPQSGERIRGLANNRTTNENYPGLPNVKTHRITGSPDKWVTTPRFTILKITGTGDDYTTESVATYPDGSMARGRHFPLPCRKDPPPRRLLRGRPGSS